MSVTKAECQAISAEIAAAIKPILERHGLDITKTMSKYGDIYSIKVEANKVSRGENGVNMESEYANDYKRFGSAYGLNEGLLGKKFTSRGREFAFAGIATSRSKYPIAALNIVEDRVYFFTKDVARLVNS